MSFGLRGCDSAIPRIASALCPLSANLRRLTNGFGLITRMGMLHGRPTSIMKSSLRDMVATNRGSLDQRGIGRQRPALVRGQGAARMVGAAGRRAYGARQIDGYGHALAIRLEKIRH